MSYISRDITVWVFVCLICESPLFGLKYVPVCLEVLKDGDGLQAIHDFHPLCLHLDILLESSQFSEICQSLPISCLLNFTFALIFIYH